MPPDSPEKGTTKRRGKGSGLWRHFREIFHQLFTIALQSGIYQPPNPHCVNPADDHPGFTGRDEPIVVLSTEVVTTQYAVVAGDPLILFGV